MALEIKLNQKLSQSLVMTPQLQQAIKLLQLGRMEYLEVLEKELLENPVLEDGRDSSSVNSESQSEQGLSQNGQSGSDSELIGADESGNSTTDPSTTTIRISDDLHWLDAIHGGAEGGSRLSSTTRRFEEDDDRPSLESTVSKPEGLANHILWQLRTSELSAADEELALQIVGNLDRNGYLCSTPEELAETCGTSVQEVERVLKIIQSLDPAGIGARDLRECLLIQLEQLGLGESLAARIVDNHLPKLEIRRYDLVAREENVALEEVYEAMKVIQKLEPRPGRPFIDEAPVYITPDIYVRRVGDEYVISLNETGMPKLRLSSRYRELLKSGEGKSASEKEYLQDCVRSASWLIKSIHQRQRTIYKVTESILKFQREFLEQGVSALKPLVLRDVADDVGIHESTVSRVTTNKYVHTPQGVFELKFFFSSGLRSGQGEVSSESVKQRIQELIAAEDARKPLSDQAIVEKLKSEGVDIARRTVAKYREMLNILSSSRRKKVF